ncbi:MAG: hypothetical protein PHP72_09020 [Dysgonamonadaceae bacterium]|jgi:hypothetical protein|nr:hypothetical protein [Dysgonamonadaceae bacterium]MDD3727069.1 hypothetical protein [Dysgonamonadaceae bacterium]MDD4606405.1 hypothetical protein [Dysgonamonadaceae bacterium]
MKRKIIFLLFSSFFTFGLFAQEKLNGVVTDSISGKSISDVYIMLMSEDGKSILSYSFSQENGAFTIEFPKTEQKTFLLTTSRMGYEPYSKKITLQTQKIDVLLKETSIPLREVKIKSTPMKQRGDTIDYYISSFLRPQDRTLADVLARMPGIELQSDGRVQYEGKPINRFYIENMNLLEQRYSIATKNLSPDDISTVQVYENHEPVKMLRDRSDSDQAALNIKLKEGAKAKWLKTIDFGIGGFPFLYNATGTFARFARGNQSMLVGKANNTGKDIFQELKMHTLKQGQIFRLGVPDGIPDQLYPLSISSSLFTRDRARFNESAITSLNQLWRVAEDVDLRLNINYGFDREKRERNIETEYRFENQPNITIKDNTSQTVDWHKLENELAFTANKSSYFLEEKLSLNFHWKDALADISSNEYQINQKMDLPRTHFKNSTSFTKLLGNVSMGIVNNTEFTQLPQSLTITSEDALPLFSGNSARQTVSFNDGFSDTYLTLSYKLRHQTIDLKAGAEWVWQDVESELDPLPQVEDSFVNSLTWNTTRFYAEPSHRVNYKQWTITSSASVNYMQADYSNKRDDYFYINPLFRVVFEPSGSIKFNAGYSYNNRYGDLNQLQTGYVLKKYNLFSKGIDELERNRSQSLIGGFFYKNISHFFNLHYLSSYSRYKSNLVPANFIQDIYSFIWWELKEKPSTFWMNRLSATKLFTEISLTAGLSVSYNLNRSVMDQQGAEIDYTNRTFDISPSLKWNAKNNLNFDYSLKALFSGVSMNNEPTGTYIPLINHQLYTFLGVSKKLAFTSNLQHFYNKAPNSSVSNLLFADVGLQYQFNRVTVNLDWTNIFNQKEQITSSYSTINTSTRIDKLRPSEILISFRFKR